MTGKTHTSVGIFTTLAILQPTSLRDIVLCACTASVGAVISDVDVTRSKAKTMLHNVIGICVGAIALMFVLNKFLNINLYSYILEDSNIYRMAVGIAAFIGICIMGERTSHRSFTHSLFGVLTMGAAVYTISPIILAPFLTSIFSHIAIDMLNKRDVRIFYPSDFGISLKLCKSDGIVSDILFWLSSFGSVVYIIWALKLNLPFSFEV